jgi:hypothetical protein
MTTDLTDARASLIEAMYARALEDENGCLIWQGPIVANGYGRFHFPDGRSISAHRRLLELSLGRELRKDEDACHHCDVRACIRFEHLFAGTRSENMLDAGRKGRTGMQRHPEANFFGSPEGRMRRAQGERHGSAKLTPEQVLAIRADNRSSASLARDYGVADRTIADIRYRRTWTHV